MHDTLVSVIRPEGAVSLRYPVRAKLEAWVLPEGPVPESIPHSSAAQRLELVLSHWAEHCGRNVRVARNLAIRWLRDAPRTGIDPDICLLEPPPEEFSELGSLCTWKPGHVVPPLCIEVVSSNHPYKDYVEIQDRYAAMGTHELVVFDPLLAGPGSLGGPVALQVWRRDRIGLFERVHFGDDPAYSEVLNAWLLPRDRMLEVANDRTGDTVWMSGEEQARLSAERALNEADRERSAREDIERRLAELEARLKGS